MEVENWKGGQGLWKDILDSKYRSWRVLDEIKESNHESWWWRDIRKICGGGQNDNWFDSNLKWSIGKGNKIRLWKNVLMGEMALKEMYPKLYSNTNLKEGT